MPTLQRSGKRMAHGSAPTDANGTPAVDTVPAQRPDNPAPRVADGVKEIAGDAGTVAQVAPACSTPNCFVGLASKYFVGKRGIWSDCFVGYGQIGCGSLSCSICTRKRSRCGPVAGGRS